MPAYNVGGLGQVVKDRMFAIALVGYAHTLGGAIASPIGPFRGRDVEAHRRWMIRNYALTYAAVTLRIQMPLLIVFGGLSGTAALNIVGWTCWVPNLIIAEIWMRLSGAGILSRRAVAG